MKSTLNTQVRKALAGLKASKTGVTRKGTEYPIYDITDCEAFWNLWKGNKESIKALGYVAYKIDRYSDRYYLRDMSKLEFDCSKKASAERSRENLVKARKVLAAKREAKKADEAKAKTVLVWTDKKIEEKPRAKVADSKKSLKASEVLELVRAGYTKAEIEAMLK